VPNAGNIPGSYKIEITSPLHAQKEKIEGEKSFNLFARHENGNDANKN
jgi:hypothetical protein